MTKKTHTPKPGDVAARPRGERLERFGRGRSISKYDPGTALAICERVAEGETLAEICGKAGMPHRTTFWRWVMLYKDLDVAYQAARELSAGAMEDKALDIAKTLEDSKNMTGTKIRALDLAMGQYRWSAARRDPGRYGQKAETNVVVPIQINTTLDLAGGDQAAQGIYTIRATMAEPTGEDILTPPSDPDRGMIPKAKKEVKDGGNNRAVGAAEDSRETGGEGER